MNKFAQLEDPLKTMVYFSKICLGRIIESNAYVFYKTGKRKIEKRKTSLLLHRSEVATDNILICIFPPSFLRGFLHSCYYTLYMYLFSPKGY